MLVTLAQAKAQHRVDNDDLDSTLTLLIRAASLAVLRYLKTPDAYQDSAGDVIVDSQGDPTEVPEDVQLAVLVLVGDMLKNPEGQAGIINPSWSPGYLPTAVVSLLYPLRDPTIA